MEKSTVAIVEDEEDIASLVGLYLEREGFTCYKFKKAESFLDYIKNNVPDVVILDLMLPDADGMEICKAMRKEGKFDNTAIIILTAKSDEVYRVLGLEMGADDYVIKPFSPRELVARVRAVQRRLRKKENEESVLKVGEILVIDRDKMEVTVKGEKVELTPTEFKILLILAEKIGWVFSRERILEKLWDYEKDTNKRAIDVHIANLRKKLKEAGKFIKSIKGIGYKLEA